MKSCHDLNSVSRIGRKVALREKESVIKYLDASKRPCFTAEGKENEREETRQEEERRDLRMK
jgi:hypothetical protein